MVIHFFKFKNLSYIIPAVSELQIVSKILDLLEGGMHKLYLPNCKDSLYALCKRHTDGKADILLQNSETQLVLPSEHKTTP